MTKEVGPLYDKQIAIIGGGAMGSALCRGLVQAGATLPGNVRISDLHVAHLKELSDALGVKAASGNLEAIEGADIVVLAVKPQSLPGVLSEISDSLAPSQLVVSIVAGVRISAIEHAIAAPVPVVRAMPNTAAQVNAGACAFCKGTRAEKRHVEWVQAIFDSVGIAVQVEERMMDAVTALSGSGPAYIYLVIEAMVEGGVKAGLPRDIARQLATQTVLGAARMVIETGRHPAQLKDMVATPSGTTIAALASLEQSGVRAALMDAVEKAAIRSKELGQ